jgi:hypothetical protein
VLCGRCVLRGGGVLRWSIMLSRSCMLRRGSVLCGRCMLCGGGVLRGSIVLCGSCVLRGDCV